MTEPEFIEGHPAELELTADDVEPDEAQEGGDSDA
jgi:hypothetical protein